MSNQETGVTEMVTITKDEYDDLQKDSNFLNALVAAGVDNWNGYDYAVDIFRESEEKPKVSVKNDIISVEQLIAKLEELSRGEQ